MLILLYLAGVVLTAVAGGILSDRTGRRKLPVTVPAWSWPWRGPARAVAILAGRDGSGGDHRPGLRGVPVGGCGPGHPGAAHGGRRAKDLGIINIANSGPQVLAPAVAAPLVSQLGGYRSLYLSVAVITVLGSLFVQRIRSVP